MKVMDEIPGFMNHVFQEYYGHWFHQRQVGTKEINGAFDDVVEKSVHHLGETHFGWEGWQWVVKEAEIDVVVEGESEGEWRREVDEVGLVRQPRH